MKAELPLALGGLAEMRVSAGGLSLSLTSDGLPAGILSMGCGGKSVLPRGVAVYVFWGIWVP